MNERGPRRDSFLDLIGTKSQPKEENFMAKVKRAHILVDPINGDYPTIAQAVEAADKDNVIKIAPGIYTQNIYIKTSGLRLEPKDKGGGDIIIICHKDPCITININPNQRCTLIGLKIGHHANDAEDPSDRVQKQGQGSSTEDQRQLRLTSNRDLSLDVLRSPSIEIVNQFKFNSEMSTNLYVQSGQVSVEDCLFSLLSVNDKCFSIIPQIAISENGSLDIMRSEIQGNKGNKISDGYSEPRKTLGIICKYGNLNMKTCKIHHHIAGGIHILGNAQSVVKIVNCKIIDNNHLGVHFMGPDSQPILESNEIQNNCLKDKDITIDQGQAFPAIRIGVGNKAQILKNEINNNHTGIEVWSADPFIFHNTIENNLKNGIYMRVHSVYRCDGRIKSNDSISSNKENGIFCEGNENYTKIEQNDRICYNKKSGIKIGEYAHVFVYKNIIQKNHGQGIILMDNSSGIIEKNDISENIKAGIALGGVNSENTLIVENEIHGQKCEGIFALNCSTAWIQRNKIFENNDGIILCTSIPHVINNEIFGNKSHGLMMIKDSRPTVKGNKIFGNYHLGIFVRDRSKGAYLDNTVSNNEVDFLVEMRHDEFDNIKEQNNIEGLVRFPQIYDCNLI